MKQSRVCSWLGVDYPIIQAPMAGVQDSALAIAVSEAGGLGSLPCAMLSVNDIANQVSLIKGSTSKPYNLNFFCHDTTEYNEVKHHQWRELLKPYFDEFSGHYDATIKASSRMPFSHDVADAIEGFVPPVISFHFGLPDAELLARIKRWGTKVLSSATTVEEALWLEENGVDGVIAQGLEAGGHRGMFLSKNISTQVGLVSLLPQIVDRVDVPVIAAGGISDARSINSALALGASAVQIGTSYLLCDEVKTSALHRAALKSQRASHTALTNVFTGRPARGIANRIMKDLGYMNENVPEFPYASMEMAQLKALAEQHGSDDFSSLWSGQNVSGCKEISAFELTRQFAEACDAVS
ncbi:nitronate monooxygenase [Marinomonas rhizomae]|uniref:Nitronate monooxygenase n=1 Tax=Marinomonas rhizomae TaxID=491948 RepID=A0A366JBZ7_9GAMM|nr:nitronate monooxygenase [Marinomonas rhizomae]RBP84337.1 nitronate monooxygenase [Marinomonas rhizomae]RNF74653.1 nitronate monooxygenase [Marinomonas rhizomae]